jgi:hypothetical protein
VSSSHAIIVPKSPAFITRSLSVLSVSRKVMGGFLTRSGRGKLTRAGSYTFQRWERVMGRERERERKRKKQKEE